MSQQRPPSNPRQDRKQSEKRLVFLIGFAFVVIGGGLIALVYDWTALLTALPCLLGGSAGILLLYTLMSAYERWRNQIK